MRAILEGLVQSYCDTLERLKALTGEPTEVLHVVGGGSQHELLCQWTADALGCEVVAGPVEATALGNLLVQAHVHGDLPEGASLREVMRRSSELMRYAPRPQDRARPRESVSGVSQ